VRAFSGSTSGSPSQQWWNRVVVEGRLGDINRALAVLTYWPDLNWNSGLERNGADLSGTVTEGIYGTQRGVGEMEMITLTVASITNSTLPVSLKVVRVRVHAANDAPVLSIPGRYLLYSIRIFQFIVFRFLYLCHIGWSTLFM
jgi:hypothetical protein